MFRTYILIPSTFEYKQYYNNLRLSANSFRYTDKGWLLVDINKVMAIKSCGCKIAKKVVVNKVS